MTTTKALAKLHKVIVGTDGKNSIAKNLESLGIQSTISIGSSKRSSDPRSAYA